MVEEAVEIATPGRYKPARAQALLVFVHTYEEHGAVARPMPLDRELDSANLDCALWLRLSSASSGRRASNPWY